MFTAGQLFGCNRSPQSRTPSWEPLPALSAGPRPPPHTRQGECRMDGSETLLTSPCLACAVAGIPKSPLGPAEPHSQPHRQLLKRPGRGTLTALVPPREASPLSELSPTRRQQAPPRGPEVAPPRPGDKTQLWGTDLGLVTVRSFCPSNKETTQLQGWAWPLHVMLL